MNPPQINAPGNTQAGAIIPSPGGEPEPLSSPAGMVVEKEGGVQPPGTPTEYGDNFEDLAQMRPDLVGQLRSLVTNFSTEDYRTRREEMRRIQLAREFWKGLHYVYYDEETETWQLPFQVQNQTPPKEQDEIPRYSYVTNFYQAFGLSIIAVLSKRAPSVKLWPQSARQEEDVATAKVGSDIITVIQRNNKVSQMLTDQAFYLWTDGTVAGYVRYVVDGDRFGYHDEQELGESMQQLDQSYFQCPECGAQNPVGPEGPRFVNLCAQCGEYLDESALVQPPAVPVPFVKNTVEMPNGQEEITLVPKLELKIPNWATRFADFPYLQWQTETHRSKLKAVYQKAQMGIASESGGLGSIGNDATERITRLSLRAGSRSAVMGDPSVNLVTFTRTWLRPWAFWILEDQKMREELLEMFPKGCYIAFAGDTYCEARNESMNDHWRILHAYPGDGQSRPGMGDIIIPLNKRFNDLSNIQQETYEFGVPPTYVDSKLLTRQAIGTQKALPGSFYFVTGKPGVSIRDSIYTPNPSQVSPDMIQSMGDLMGPMAQFLTGAFPALFGGEMESNDTASGYAMARDQAMGRIGLVWDAIKWFWSEMMMLGIECFRTNRQDDVEMTLEGKGGTWDSQFIKKADLKGNLYATPEVDESFPQTYSQMRATVMELMQSQDPYIQKIMGGTVNVKLTKRLLGLEQYVIPEEDSETKQYREISMMLQSQPTMVPGAPQMDQATGQPQMDPTGLPAVGQPTFAPSVPVDPQVDDNETEAEICKMWLNSQEGQSTKFTNPAGYANVRAHLLMHEEAVMQQAIQQAMLAGPAPGEGKPAQKGVSQ
jgi:hypothetical protein